MKRPTGFDPGDSPEQDDRRPSRPLRETISPLIRESSPPPTQSDIAPESSEAEQDTPAAVVPDESFDVLQDARPHSRREKQALRDLKRAHRQRRRGEKRERKRFTGAARLRRRRVLVPIAAVLGLALFVAVGVLSPILNVRTITIVGAERIDPNLIVERLQPQLGTPLALLDEAGIRETLSAFPLIKEYAVETIPPHELVVRIVERQPVMSLKRGEIFDLVDAAGVVMQSQQERIPGFPLGEGLVVDVNSPAFEATAKSLTYMLPELAAQVNLATATTDQDVTFTMSSGLVIVWGSAEQSVKKSVLVNTMLSSLAGQSISRIDVSSVEAPVFS